mgnify:CR=1 FL=1
MFFLKFKSRFRRKKEIKSRKICIDRKNKKHTVFSVLFYNIATIYRPYAKKVNISIDRFYQRRLFFLFYFGSISSIQDYSIDESGNGTDK